MTHTEGGEAHERRVNLLLLVVKHSSKWEQYLDGERGGVARIIIARFAVIGTDVSIAKAVVLCAAILNGNWFPEQPAI